MPVPEPALFCKDCKHFYRGDKYGGLPECTYTQGTNRHVSPVWGIDEYPHYPHLYPNAARAVGGGCGPEAIHFEWRSNALDDSKP